MKSVKEVLIYKRTHTGDPNEAGHFGVNDCMGMVRNRHYDAVIGIGGVGAEPRMFNIARKINWIGIGPRRRNFGDGKRGPIVTFDRFLLLDQYGPLLDTEAPYLAKHMYDTNRRVVMSSSLSPRVQKEVHEILRTAMGSTRVRIPPRTSSDRPTDRNVICQPKRKKQLSRRGPC